MNFLLPNPRKPNNHLPKMPLKANTPIIGDEAVMGELSEIAWIGGLEPGLEVWVGQRPSAF
jgi:hypothetical protein